MDGNGSISARNWGFVDQGTSSLKGQLSLHLRPSIAEKPLLGGGRDHLLHHNNHYYYHQQDQAHHPAVMASTNGGAFHHHRVGGISESTVAVDYMSNPWLNYKERFLNVLPGNHQNHHHHHHHSFGVLPETSSAQSVVQMIQPNSMLKNEHISPRANEISQEREDTELAKKRGGGKLQKSPKSKKPKKTPKVPKDESIPSVPRKRAPKKNAEVVINGIRLDLSGIPIPICSCTGTPQQCYRWGAGGWQSACCTTSLSVYPLPMSTKRRGARIAGRKMSLGAFKKVLEKLASEGYNFSNPIDLRLHWAKHGTNKFVTIR